MSRNITFYSISKAENLPDGIIDLDQLQGFDYEYAEDAQDFAKKTGTLSKTTMKRIDLFKTSEILFGERAVSITYRGWFENGDPDRYTSEKKFCMKDGTSHRVEEKDLEQYYFDDVRDAYIFKRDIISSSSCYMIDETDGYEGRILEEEDFLCLMKKCIETDDGYYSAYTGELLFAITQAFFRHKNGEAVIAVID